MRASPRAMAVVVLCGVGLLGCPGSERNAAADDAQSSVDAIVDTGAGAEVGTDTGSSVDAGSVDADAGAPIEAAVDVPGVDIVTTSDAPDAGTDTGVDAPDADAGTTTPDGGIQMTFTFVSAALVSAPGSAIQMNAQISWHGSLHGSAGGITFHGTIH